MNHLPSLLSGDPRLLVVALSIPLFPSMPRIIPFPDAVSHRPAPAGGGCDSVVKNHVLAAARNRPVIVDRVLNHGLSISTSLIRVSRISAILAAVHHREALGILDDGALDSTVSPLRSQRKSTV